MEQEITKIINKWDPIGIKNITPEDEYSYEIEEIIEFIKKGKNISIDTLMVKIDEVFKKWFGDDVYHPNYEELTRVAQEIIELCKIEKIK